MELLWFAVINDWPVLIPIVACSIILIGVALQRWYFYNQNKRDVVQFIHRLQRELQRGSLDNAQLLSTQLGSVIGEVSEEGVRLLSEQPENFDRSFDITAALATRKLERNLSILGTIATISPYLGLFGTVVRILLTFGDLSKSGSGAPEIMFGIGSALIATAFGLGVAIAAVTLNNYFQSVVARYVDDFQLLKLLFLSFADTDLQPLSGVPVPQGAGMSQPGSPGGGHTPMMTADPRTRYSS